MTSCLVDAGADTPDLLAVYLGGLGLGFEILDAPELSAATARLAERRRLAAEGARGAW